MDFHSLCAFLLMASDEMGLQEDRYQKIMKESLIILNIVVNYLGYVEKISNCVCQIFVRNYRNIHVFP